MLIPFLGSVSHRFSHSWHFLADYQARPPASSQTNTESSKPHAGVRLQTRPHLTRISNADFFMNRYSRSSGGPFSLEGCAGSPALWFCTMNSSRTPLCFSPYNSLVPAQTGSGGHCLEKSPSPPLNSVVRT